MKTYQIERLNSNDEVECTYFEKGLNRLDAYFRAEGYDEEQKETVKTRKRNLSDYPRLSTSCYKLIYYPQKEAVMCQYRTSKKNMPKDTLKSWMKSRSGQLRGQKSVGDQKRQLVENR